MANLLEETEAALRRHNLSWSDLAAVLTSKGRISAERFKALAKRTNYDAGYGLQEIDAALVLALGNGGWLRRREYDGAEWWEYCKCPPIPEECVDAKVKSLKERM